MTREEHVHGELERLFREWSVRAAPIGAALFLLIAPLDFISVPDLAGRFLLYRLAAAAGLLLIWYPVSRAPSPLALRAWVLAGVTLSAVTIEVMILSQPGSHSAYGYGMVLLAVTALGLIPASAGFHSTVSAAIFATFLVPLLLWGEPFPPGVFLTQNYLFAAILAVMVLMRHLHRASQVREIGLSFDLVASERQLEKQVAERTAQLVNASNEWRAAVDSTGDLMLMLDSGGRVVKSNLATSVFLGIALRELIGRPAAGLLCGAGLDEALIPLERAWCNGARAAGEVRHAASDRWFLATAEPIPQGLARAGGVVLTLRDVTDVKIMERAVTEARDEWEKTFDSIQEGITIHDANFVVLRANAAAHRLLGCEKGALAGRRCFELFHGQQAPIGGCPGCEASRTGRPTTVNLNEPHLGRHLEITALPRPGGGITHVMHDISERRRAMDGLSRAAGRLQRILGHAPFGIFVVNEELRVEFANPAMLVISGYPREQFVGAALSGFPGCQELGMAPLVQEALQGVPFRFGPARFHCRDGRPVVGRFTGIPVEEDGRRKAVVFVEDVTSLTGAEQERHRLNTLLLQAQKMQSVGTLASGIAHDFNNILLAVIGLTDAAAERLPAGHFALPELEAVISAAERGSELVQQLLAFSRHQELRLHPVDLRRLVDQTRTMLARVIPKTIEIDARGEADLPPVIADPAQIGQVLMNLTVNARDAMPAGGTLAFETRTVGVLADDPAHPGVAPGDYVLLAVSDTGTGMSPEVLARIFDPFFTTKELGKGSGLGLATVHGIVAQHGGATRVESQPGVGTTFFIYLPAAPGAGSGDARPVPRGNETLLLVAEDTLARHVIGSTLVDLGYQVREVVDGEEALRLLEIDGLRPDLLLCDVVLSGVGARQIAGVARARAPQARVVFMSGSPESQLVQRGLLKPGDRLLSKNLGPEEIARQVRVALDGVVLD